MGTPPPARSAAKMMESATYGKAHVWVNVWEECNDCNYQNHKCYFCGADLDHVGYDTDGNNHTVEFCRPDLGAHVAGPLCTWPATGDVETDALLGRPNCYWDHEKNQIKE